MTITLHIQALEPDQVYAVHIDNGFMRKNESAKVEESLQTLGLNLRVINAWHQFYTGTTMIPMKPEEIPEGCSLTFLFCIVLLIVVLAFKF